MAESSSSQGVVCETEQAGVELWVVAEFAFLKLVKVSRVFLVGEVVAGNVVGPESEGLRKIIGPRLFGLVRNREHEVEIAGGDFGLAQEMKGFGCSLGGVVAPKGFELVSLEGLHS